MTFVRNLDLVLLALALPVFLIAGLPFLGWATAAAVWAVWRGIGEWGDRRANAAGAAGDPRKMAGIAAGSMIGRGWLMGDRGDLGAGTGRVPDIGTWRTDIGGGFDFGGFGVYVTQSVSENGLKPNVFVRLGRRF